MNSLAGDLDVPLPLNHYRLRFGCSRTTLWRYSKAGLPTLRVRGKTFIVEREFIAFLQRMNRSGIVTAAACPRKGQQ